MDSKQNPTLSTEICYLSSSNTQIKVGSINESKERVTINISGQKFELFRETLKNYPHTRLGKIINETKLRVDTASEATEPLFDCYDPVIREYFFQRNPACFPLVISFYVNSILHVPRHMCSEQFQDEMEFWIIPFVLTDCCQGFHRQEWEVSEGVRKTNQLFERQTKKSIAQSMSSKAELVKLTSWDRWRNKVWDLFENSESSKAASIVSILSSTMVFLSTVILCVNTHPDVRINLPDGSKEDNPHLFIAEIMCIIWFTFEYLIRVITCPSLKKFLCSAMNTIDLLAIIPFYISVIVELADVNVSSNFTSARKIVQILRIFRIVRIFKVARHSTGLQVLGYTVKNSMPELSLLFMLLLMGMTLFSSLIYFAEEEVENSKFRSIIGAFWWAIITMTTVGYGDMYPKTTLGQIIGSICCISGILFIALPIPTIVTNFSSFYKDHRNKQKLNKICAANGPINESEVSLLSLENSYTRMQVPSIGEKVSVLQIERQGNYLRKLSTISESQIVAFSNKVYPAIIEEV